MHGTYLFAQGRDGLYIIDQHAAQERVKYEEYRESIGNVDQSQQQLLVPYIFEFPADDAPSSQGKNVSLRGSWRLFSRVRGESIILREHPIGWQRRKSSQGSMRCVTCSS